MYKDPFEILGVSKNCTQSELYTAYIGLKTKYENERFMEGESGFLAAKKLDEINQAYDNALKELSNSYTIKEGVISYTKIEEEIKNGNLDEAQKLLDGVTERGAEWHYIQAIIFYKKNWLLDSRSQLVLACQLDPSNKKYSDTLQRLDATINSKNPFNNVGNEHGNSRSYVDPEARRTGAPAADPCCSTCQTLICIDCCCECMGGDCISCC